MLRYFSVDRSLMKDSAMDSLGDESIISLRIHRERNKWNASLFLGGQKPHERFSNGLLETNRSFHFVFIGNFHGTIFGTLYIAVLRSNSAVSDDQPYFYEDGQNRI
ncbi:hypothetical protein CEXT_266961 [Caerostris extrusa]|uniref:Uncharacterized protein n=1 Tax=Caerostris extrusa TaxID=172846 RepID=A0AAV4SHW2_CAEEX|nr:hypothetical protein CEXT_266961 [Caerostris extrusa]